MKHKTITIRERTFESLGIEPKDVNIMMLKEIEEQEKLKRFAQKIKKIPESVRVYT